MGIGDCFMRGLSEGRFGFQLLAYFVIKNRIEGQTMDPLRLMLSNNSREEHLCKNTPYNLGTLVSFSNKISILPRYAANKI